MYCQYCNGQTRDESVYCSQCGKKITAFSPRQQTTPVFDVIKKNKKKIAVICVIAVLIVAVSIGIRAMSPSKSIVGTWRSSTGKEIYFSENGYFEDFRGYGRYTIYDGKKLSLVYEDWDWLGEYFTYNYGDEWYVSGNRLYISGDYYTRQ